jgi:hypothetical protein
MQRCGRLRKTALVDDGGEEPEMMKVHMYYWFS